MKKDKSNFEDSKFEKIIFISTSGSKKIDDYIKILNDCILIKNEILIKS